MQGSGTDDWVIQIMRMRLGMRRDSGGTRWCMQCVRIDQDHKDSSTKSGRGLSRRVAREYVHKRDVIFQSRVTVRDPVLHCV